MAQRADRKQRLSLNVSIKAMAVVVGLGIPTFVTSSLYRQYEEDLRAAEVVTANTTRALEQHAARTIEKVDTYLQAVISLVGSRVESLSPEAVHKALREKLTQSEDLTNILVLDANGVVVHEAKSFPARPTDRSEHDYLLTLRNQPNVGLFVGASILGRDSRLSILPIARRINHPDGSFAGVIVATLKTAVFQSVFETFDHGPDSTFGLWRSDGTLLVRAPHAPTLIGKNYATTENYKRHVVPMDTRPFWSVGSTDGVHRVLAFGFVPSYPLYVSATQSRETALIGWHQAAWTQGGIAGGLTLAVVMALMALARELKQRRQSEQFLRVSEERYRLLANAATDMIVLTDLDGIRQYVSPASRELLGYEPGELIGKQVFATAHADDAHQLSLIFTSVQAAAPEQAISINRMCRKDGTYVWVETKLKLVRDDTTAEPSGIIFAARDVSERQSRAEELSIAKDAAEAAASAKGDFLASMSHELRTPLNAIIGFSRLMVEEGEMAMPTMHRYARLVQDASTTLLSIVNDVLDVSKLETGNLDLDPHPFSPRDLVESAATLLRGQAEAKGLALHVEAEPTLPATLVGDDTRLRQVLLNLLSNAVKFTAEGMVWVFVGCEGEEQGVARVRFSVMDTGIGIPVNRQHRLFKRFSQVDNSTARQFGGTGLGLAICKSLVEVMGGSIVVESVEGEGTTFSFVLDLPVAEAIPALQEATAPRSASLSVRSAHILLAEDVKMNQELAVALLTRWGHTVEVAPDGASAVAAVMRTRFDLVLMDVQMPVMDGIEATRRIRALGGSYATLPIVAMTANVMSRDIAICREAGVDDHIGKPFVPDNLRLLVERLTASKDEAAGSSVSETMATSHSILDLAILGDLAELMGPARVGSLLTKLKIHLENNPLLATNLDTLRFEAHALISWSGMLGLSELSEACRSLEFACEGLDNQRLQLPARLIEAQGAIERAKARLAHHLSSLPDEQAA